MCRARLLHIPEPADRLAPPSETSELREAEREKKKKKEDHTPFIREDDEAANCPAM